ncbi:MAG TPA: hypothetical protein EYP10_00640 [Armatimonadetes bacterium]|nr:hypothetical protein [Armatimonadota bacterium]
MKRAARAGYNGIALSDYKFNILDRMPERYFRNLAKVRDVASRLKLDIYPCVMPIGYSSGILAHDPNLAEGLPVKDALFIVRGKEAHLIAHPPVELRNGDFERVNGHRFIGWDFQDGIGISTFAEHSIVHSGTVAIRMENFRKGNKHGNCRVMQTVKVAPFRQYHVSVWIRSEVVSPADSIRILILAPDGMTLSYNDLKVKPTQSWREHHIVFNSLRYNHVRIYIGIWGGNRGRIWFDDARIEEVGFLNLLRRLGCPLVVRGEDGTIYEEGRDFEPVRDERMGMAPYIGHYEVYHKPPPLRLTPNSRIKDGERLRVSFYHTMLIYWGQVMCCLSEPKVYEILRDQIERVDAALKPKGFSMQHDEIRIANWCLACQRRKMTPGQLLADNVRRCVKIIRTVRPNAEIFVWSDMFDPHHNARDRYYLVNGTLEGSWEGLARDVIIVNWNFRKRHESMRWFAKRGHKQILAGYYDGNPMRIRTWLNDARNIEGIIGVMYTTWQHKYDDLEEFARAVGW